jgi:uncharacterized protein YdaU (DUF1376 family)
MTKKDTFYFSHDYNARNDPKLVKLRVQLGHEAIGVYWSLVEYLYEQKGYLNINELDLIADSLHTKFDLLEKIVKNFDLFILKEKEFYSKAIIKRLKLRTEKSQKLKENARKGWEKRKTEGMQLHSNGNAIAMQTECNSNAIKERKGKERKGKENTTIAQNKKKLEEAVKQVGASMTAKPDNIFEFILVGRNNYQTRREIPLKQLIRAKYKTPFDFRKHIENLKARPREDFAFDNKDDESILEFLADMILTSNELESTGINSNLKPELVKEMKLILETKHKIK